MRKYIQGVLRQVAGSEKRIQGVLRSLAVRKYTGCPQVNGSEKIYRVSSGHGQ